MTIHQDGGPSIASAGHSANIGIVDASGKRSLANGKGDERPSATTWTRHHRQQANGNPAKSNGLASQNGNGTANGKTADSKDDSMPVWDSSKESFEPVPLVTAALTYLGFYLLMLLGLINQMLFTPKVATERNREGYAPLYDVFESFYMRYVYRRIRDCFNRPICGVAGAEVVLKDRRSPDSGWTFEFTGEQRRCLNLGSYNYLGFSENHGPCLESTIRSISEHGLAMCSSRRELGTTALHTEVERITAEFMGVEDALVFGMGFATNSLNLPALMGPGCLVLSDEKNHASIIAGLRLAGVKTRVFRHNNMRDLERRLQEAVFNGQPESGEPWRKIFIVVEGIFSMEGTIVRLPEIVALKKKYKAYVYLDEAHSVGAMGKRGRGAADYFGLDPRDIDVLMGTFSKNFAAVGGYLAGSKRLIDHLRAHSHAHCYGSSMSPPVAAQILASMRVLMGKDGTNVGQTKVTQLARNTQYFRKSLAQMGVITYGHEDSPVVPMMVYLFSKISAVVRRLTQRNIAVVGVGFPATPIMAGRIRFCISAAHTKEQLDYALRVIDEEADALGLKYSRKRRDRTPIVY